jgi:aryl-alcohol dehydrogenase-like predicted oxidoreductase/AcrR family transcriptional regulator
MRRHSLGSTGLEVSELSLGCMGMSDFYGPADRAESIATIHAALDAGITLLDTGDYYAAGHNELLIGEALRARERDRVAISVKFGLLRAPDGAVVGIDGRPEAVKSSLAYTLRRLGIDHVDVYRLGRADPAVPIEETVGAIAEMVQAGYVRHVGLSEAGAETVRRAHAVHPVADLQIEYSLLSRRIEDEILPTCRELGVGITAYGVLSRGLLSGHWSKERAETAGAFRQTAPRFTGENLDRNLALVEALRSVAESKGAKVAQLAIAWVLSRGEDIVPLVGARRRDPAGRGPRRDGAPPDVRRPRGDRARRARRRGGGRPLPCAADGHARQRGRRGGGGVTETVLTSERILETAEDVLRRYGPAKATVVDVARALEVSHGSVYRHFPSKAALRDAVAERWLARVSDPLQAVADEEGPSLGRLRRWLELLIASKRSRALQDPELFATYVRLVEESREVVQAHVRTLTGQLARIIDDGVRRGELSDVDPAVASRAVFDATARFHNPAHATEWSDPGIDAAFEGVWSLLVAALGPRA